MRRRPFLLLLASACVPPRPGGEVDVPRGSEPARRTAPPKPVGDDREGRIPLAELEQRAELLRERHRKRGFTVVVESPFVVIGDEPRAQVDEHAERTIRWAVERLRGEYFDRDPVSVIDVWLFGSDASYEKNARELFGDHPDTPYGYYSPDHGALVMNISTGGGTLVHEIVHPFMASNFAAAPSWFDEGLASLYEQSAEHDGHIWGLTNWRLPALQQAIRAGKVPSFATLTATGDRPFYDDDPGTNYAQARYLCMWLQEQRLLQEFYRAFVRASASDPSGYATLQASIGTDDMDAWQHEWQAWVLGLRFG
jgi:hypothetical protein